MIKKGHCFFRLGMQETSTESNIQNALLQNEGSLNTGLWRAMNWPVELEAGAVTAAEILNPKNTTRQAISKKQIIFSLNLIILCKF